MSTLTKDILKNAGAFVGAPVRVQVKEPDTGNLYDIWVKQQSLGDAMTVLDAMGGSNANSVKTICHALAICILDEAGQPIFMVGDLLSLNKDSLWYSELLEAYLSVNGAKKKPQSAQ